MIAPGDVAGRRGGSRSVHGLRTPPEAARPANAGIEKPRNLVG